MTNTLKFSVCVCVGGQLRGAWLTPAWLRACFTHLKVVVVVVEMRVIFISSLSPTVNTRISFFLKLLKKLCVLSATCTVEALSPR